MYISIFTLEPVASLSALGIGLCWSLVFGGSTGGLIAIAYNLFSFVQGSGAADHRTAHA